jgi:Flp pilus assembly protein TadD
MRNAILALGVSTALALSAAPVSAAKREPAAADSYPGVAAEVQRALDEQRLVDAGRMLDRALLGGAKDSRLATLSGELELARGRYDNALVAFKRSEVIESERARSLQGQGLALSLLRRSAEAVPMLERAVAEDPGAWRAWNALGAELDTRREFARADQAYEQAIKGSGGHASVLNNRGFSHLLRGEVEPAAKDFVEALTKKPDLAVARTNLRLALAMRGDYDRAVAGGAKGDKAALLNNAGFAAMLRGDYDRAEALFNDAMQSKGEFYGRASANLDTSRALASRDKAGPGEPR